jgi:hypothetical protein
MLLKKKLDRLPRPVVCLVAIAFAMIGFGCEGGVEAGGLRPSTFDGDASVGVDDSDDISTEELASTFVGRYRFRNGEGQCITRGGRYYAVTQPCANSAAEVFDVHQTTDGRYNICEVGTTSCLSTSHGKYLGFSSLSLSTGRLSDNGGGLIGYPGKTGVVYRTAESGGGNLLRLGTSQRTPDRVWSFIRVP